MTDLAVSALSRKRAELAGELEELERRCVRLRADMVHLDAAMAIVDPSRCGAADVPRLRAQHRPAWLANLGRLILDVLRGATEPMTSRQVAVAVMGLAGLDTGDVRTVRVVEHRVAASLNRRIGIVERVAIDSRWKEWRAAT